MKRHRLASNTRETKRELVYARLNSFDAKRDTDKRLSYSVTKRLLEKLSRQQLAVDLTERKTLTADVWHRHMQQRVSLQEAVPVKSSAA